MSVTNDRGDLIELIHRLYACTDDGRFDDLRSVFSEGVKAGAPGGGVVEGQDRLITTLSAAHSTGQRSQHLVHNVLVDVDGDQAGVRADVIAIHCDSDKPEGR
ncbi:MAG TPA: nuclear transport factor 2 family protein, partial [Amycolatopsis sp.]|nr:nuclear transport factor 2 family protein [Amycolatopsis sp.]